MYGATVQASYARVLGIGYWESAKIDALGDVWWFENLQMSKATLIN